MRKSGLNILIVLALGFTLTACDKCGDSLWKSSWERKPASCQPQK